MIVLDTNVLSEVLRPRPSGAVIAWLQSQPVFAVYTTSITQAEILYGVEILADGKRKAALHSAVSKVLLEAFQGRILPFDESAAQVYPKLVAARRAKGRAMSQYDAMIASIAKLHGASLATRNVEDFADCGVRIINPWGPARK